MKTLEELRARHAEIVDRSEELNEEFRDAEFPETEQAEWDALDTERAQIEASIARIEKRQEAIKNTDVRATESGDKRKPVGARKPAAKKEDEFRSIEDIRNDAFTSDDFVQQVKDEARSIAEKLPIPRSFNQDEGRNRLMELLEERDNASGDFAKRIVITSSPLYERAFGKAMIAQNLAMLSPEEQRALAVGASATGGYAVPPQLDPTVILTDSLGVSPIREYARVETITGNVWQGIMSAGVTVSRSAEAEEAGDDSPTLSQPTVSPTRVDGFVPFSYELDQDWNGLRGEVVRMLGRAKTKEENASFTTGVGTTVFPQGLLVGATSTVSTTTAATFVVADLYKVEQALPPEFRQGAAWLANHTIYNLVRQFGVSDGHALWERIGAGVPPELLGYPALENSFMASTVAASAKLAVFGNLYEAYIIVDRAGMDVELIPHLFGASGRPTGQRGIFAVWRNGAKVINPNAVRVLVA